MPGIYSQNVVWQPKHELALVKYKLVFRITCLFWQAADIFSLSLRTKKVFLSIATHSTAAHVGKEVIMKGNYESCIEACSHCTTVCERFAAACLDDKNIQQMARCIELNLDCSLLSMVTQNC